MHAPHPRSNSQDQQYYWEYQTAESNLEVSSPPNPSPDFQNQTNHLSGKTALHRNSHHLAMTIWLASSVSVASTQSPPTPARSTFLSLLQTMREQVLAQLAAHHCQCKLSSSVFLAPFLRFDYEIVFIVVVVMSLAQAEVEDLAVSAVSILSSV